MGKRAFLCEADAAQILRRYDAVTVMGLIREVAKFDGAELDWNVLVQKSTTGISNVREYQALWRHIAYRGDLADHYEDDDPPSDDDSDLDLELLPSPPVSSEANAEVVRWVKADMQQFGIRTRKRVQGKSKAKEPKTVAIEANESPALPGDTVNGTPKKKSSGASGKARNKTPKKSAMPPCVTSSEINAASPPVTKVGEGVPETPETTLTTTATLGSERKKRKFWTPEEDQELLSAVEKFGEGQWTNILKGSFTHERTAAQLSQRWHLLRKRREQAAAANRLLEGAGEGNTVQSTAAGPILPSNPADNKNAAGHKSPPAPVANGNGNEAVLSSPTPAASPVEPLPSLGSEDSAVNITSSSPPGSKPVDVKVSNGSTSVPSDSMDTSNLKEEISEPAVGTAGTQGESLSGQGQSQADASEIAAAASLGGEMSEPSAAATAAPVVPVSQDPIDGAKNAIANGDGWAGHAVAPSGVSSSSAVASGSASSQAVAAAKPISGWGPPAGTPPPKNITRSNSEGAGSRGGGLAKQQPSTTGPDPGVQAAAVAAGARIAPPSAAASLLKAAQSGNVVHIGPDGLPITKSSQAGAGPGASSNGGGAIVHYFCTGANATAAPSTTQQQQQQQQGVASTQSGQRPAQQTKNQMGKGAMAATSQTGSPAANASPSSSTSPPASTE